MARVIAAASIDECLAAVTACGSCGYLIAAPLPPAGRCPECGGGYDRRELVLFGRPRSAASVLLEAAVLVGLTAYGIGAGHHGRFDVYSHLFQVFLLVGPAGVLVGRVFAKRPGAARLRLTMVGCAVDREPPTPSGALLFGVVVEKAFGRRPREGRPLVPTWQAGPVVPWSSVASIRVEPARGGGWRLRAAPSPAWADSATRIRLQFDAGPEQIDAMSAFAGRFTTVERR